MQPEQRKRVADFKTHITTSTVLGVGYAAGAYQFFDVPAPTCILAGALCSVSGMLPDLDSDSGVPLRESLAFGSAFVPMLLVPRLEQEFGWPLETIILVGAVLYVTIRFGFGKLLKKYTVHRGMFHSIPAAIIFGELAFLLCANGPFALRAYKACAVLVGFFSHLILDEIWSIRFKGGIGLKSSSGTAMKFWSDSMWGNLSCYGKLALFSFLTMADPIWAGVSPLTDGVHQVCAKWIGIEEQTKNRFEQLVAKPKEEVLNRLNNAVTGGSPTGTGASAASTGGVARSPTGTMSASTPAAFASQQPQQPSPALLQQQQQQAYTQQQAYAAQQLAAQQQAVQQQAYAAQQQAAYQQWYQQQLYQQQLAQYQAAQQQAAYAQYQRQFQQPQQPYYPQQHDPRTRPPQAYQQLPPYSLPPRADNPSRQRY